MKDVIKATALRWLGASNDPSSLVADLALSNLQVKYIMILICLLRSRCASKMMKR